MRRGFEFECTEDNDADIDVCLGCGRYYGTTPMLIEAWHKSVNYREGAVMDQLCYGCMTGTRTPPHEY